MSGGSDATAAAAERERLRNEGNAAYKAGRFAEAAEQQRELLDLDEWTLHRVLDFLTLKEVMRVGAVCKWLRKAVMSYNVEKELSRSLSRVDVRPQAEWAPHENAWNHRRRVLCNGRVLGSYVWGDRGGWVAAIDPLHDFLRDKLGLGALVEIAGLLDTGDFLHNDADLRLRALPCSEGEADSWLSQYIRWMPPQRLAAGAGVAHAQMMRVSFHGKELGSVEVPWVGDTNEARHAVSEALGLEGDALRALRLERGSAGVWIPRLVGIPAPLDALAERLEATIAQHLVHEALRLPL